jgi:hypothetical protein
MLFGKWRKEIKSAYFPLRPLTPMGKRKSIALIGVILLSVIFIASCGGSTGTDGSGASSGTDYGKKTVYDTN